jgi:hypothetical protein
MTDASGNLPVFQPGDAVRYFSLAGDTFDAVVTKTHAGEYVDLDVAIPGQREPFALHHIRVGRVSLPERA